jgi:hypothetical protein
MDERVSGSTLRKIGANLGRFADVRESAKEPMDRVVVQANGETLKVVAGASSGTIIATVHATTKQFRAVISAREFLTACKEAETKKEYWIEDLNKGWEIGCTLVGPKNEDFPRLTKKIPTLLMPPDISAQSQGSIAFTGDELETLGRVLPGVVEYDQSPISVAGKIWTKRDTVRFAATNNIRFAAKEFKGNYELFGYVYAGFLEAARGIGDAEMNLWSDEKVTLHNDAYRVVGLYKMLRVGGPLDFKQDALHPIKYKTVVDRVKFVKTLREQQKFDNMGRVTLQYEDDTLKVVPYEGKAGWHARGENMLKVLTALSDKQVGIGLRIADKQPINVRIPEWTIEVAPVL